MENNPDETKPKMEVIVMPYHGQGHLNTMLQFAKRLAWKSNGTIHITLATTLSTSQKMIKSISGTKIEQFLTTQIIYDDTNDTQLNFMSRMKKFETEAGHELTRILSTNPTPSLLVYDANLPWALDIAKQYGILAAAFFTQACAYVTSFYPLFVEEYKDDVDHPVIAGADQNCLDHLSIKVPKPEELQTGLPNIQVNNPDSDSNKKSIHPIIRMVISHMKNIHLADWVLFNSFDHLEDEVVKWMSNIWHVKTIGPTIPSVYLDKRVEYDVDYGFNMYKVNNESCMSWLNAQHVASVVYVSFGSAASLSIEQIFEIAEALKQIPNNFLWVVRETEQKKLPKDFINETSEKGLVLSWCPQLDVLAHEAVGCFITHCGWNSTIEALSFGVPMLAMPQFMDQMVDAHFVDQVWGVGIKPKENENKLVTCDEIKHSLEEIMHGQKAGKIKENVKKWKSLAIKAVNIGGSSDNNIDEIINKLTAS
ncbi:unnamed protein product [Amaranthus hypochondriacus]